MHSLSQLPPLEWRSRRWSVKFYWLPMDWFGKKKQRNSASRRAQHITRRSGGDLKNRKTLSIENEGFENAFNGAINWFISISYIVHRTIQDSTSIKNHKYFRSLNIVDKRNRAMNANQCCGILLMARCCIAVVHARCLCSYTESVKSDDNESAFKFKHKKWFVYAANIYLLSSLISPFSPLPLSDSCKQ